jgi:glycerophosphoryl diester phosphodiesterase
LIAPRDNTNKLTKPTTLVADAHKAGLLVHPWTFRNENSFLPENYRSGNDRDPGYESNYGNAFAEYKLFYDLGVDGVFSENPDTALEARNSNGRK